MLAPIVYTDEVLLYGLARYFGLRKGRRKSSAGLVVAGLLLTLYRVRVPMKRNDLMAAAGMSHVQAVTFRTYTCFIRSALGEDAINLDGVHYQLSYKARKEVEAAFKFIRDEMDEAITPTLRKAIVALVHSEAMG